MAKLTTNDLVSLTNQTSAITTINNNNALIEEAMENTLSLDGTSPNQMEASLDMNGNHILNLPYPSTPTEPARYDQIINLATEAGFTEEAVGATGALMDADFVANGLMTRTAAGTYTNRTLTAGTGITVTNGNGVSGNPTVAITSTLYVEGPASATDNNIPRFDLTTGKLIQTSAATISDTGGLAISGTAPLISLTDTTNSAAHSLTANNEDLVLHADSANVASGNIALATQGTTRLTVETGAFLAGATSGDLGAGTLNATTLYQNGVALWRTAVKAADQTVQSNTTLFNDDSLKFAMLANTTYRFRAFVIFDTGLTGDFKYRHTGPASPTLVRIKRSHIIGAGTAYAGIALDQAYSSGDIAIAGAAGTGWFELEGVIVNGANAGDFQIQWAQNATEAVDTTVRRGSYIDYRIVA